MKKPRRIAGRVFASSVHGRMQERASAAENQADRRPPNVVLIVVDDHGIRGPRLLRFEADSHASDRPAWRKRVCG